MICDPHNLEKGCHLDVDISGTTTSFKTLRLARATHQGRNEGNGSQGNEKKPWTISLKTTLGHGQTKTKQIASQISLTKNVIHPTTSIDMVLFVKRLFHLCTPILPLPCGWPTFADLKYILKSSLQINANANHHVLSKTHGHEGLSIEDKRQNVLRSIHQTFAEIQPRNVFVRGWQLELHGSPVWDGETASQVLRLLDFLVNNLVGAEIFPKHLPFIENIFPWRLAPYLCRETYLSTCFKFILHHFAESAQFHWGLC